MTSCSDTRTALAAGREDAGILEHLEACRDCQRALDGGTALEPPATPAPPPALRERLDEALARERGPVAWLRERPLVLRALPCLLVLSAWLVQAGTQSVHRELDAYPRGRLVALVLSLLACGVLGLSLSLRSLARRAPPIARAHAFIGAALLVPILLALLPEVHTGPWTGRGLGAELLPLALHCLGVGVGIALSLLVLLRLADRAAHAARARALLAAASAAAFGNLVLFVRCPLDAPLHLLLGHATVGIVLAVGYRLARR